MLLIWVEPVGRLIHNEHRRIVYDRLCETGAMTKSFGKRLHSLMPDRFEKAHLDDTLYRTRLVNAPKTAHLCGEIEKPIHRHVGIRRRVLRQISYHSLRCDRVRCDVELSHDDFPMGRWDEAGYHAH